MPRVEPFFAAFASAVLDAGQPVPAGVSAHHGGSPGKRFSVYRNNIAVSLSEALRVQFPAVERLLGAEYFAFLARRYLEKEPPHSPVLAEYGDGFPAFLAAFAPLAALPYLADVARIDRAQVRAYHAADAAPVAPGAFVTLGEEAIGALLLGLHPSVHIVRSPYRAPDIWRANRSEAASSGFNPAGEQITLVVRPALEVRTLFLSVPAATLAAGFVPARTLPQVLGAMARKGIGEETAATALGELLAAGALTLVEPAGRENWA